MSPHYRGQKKYFSNKRKSVRRGNEPGSLQSGVRIAIDTGPLTLPLLMNQTCSSSIHVYKKTACSGFLLYLDDVMRAFQKKRGLDIQDWYFGERMDNNSAVEKEKKRRKDKIFLKNYVYTQFLVFVRLPIYLLSNKCSFFYQWRDPQWISELTSLTPQ